MRRTGRALQGLGAAFLGLLAGCGGASEPSWLDLSRVPLGPALTAEARPEGVRAVTEDGALWLVAEVTRAQWQPLSAAGRYRAPLSVLAVGRGTGASYRLRSGERSFAFESDLARFAAAAQPATFTVNAAEGLSLLLCLEPGADPPQSAELWARLAFEEQTEAGRRLEGRRLSGAGLWVASGHSRTLPLRIPPRARLSFATAVEPLLAAREMRTAPQVFRVLLDGAPILEKRIEVDMLGEALVWHTLELPAGGVQHAQLQFEVAGPLALTSILAPVIGPREIGTYAERPRQAPRRAPDLVVFLADTFRADNLAAYGGALGITPALDAFARRARTFTRAWSTSTHTLPAHSSIFSGVYPHENGQVDFDNPLPREVETLAELLTRAGYRCGLFSDGLMVSNAHGLDQGFATFDERREAGTLERARAFLEADDGRPIFLFAQTYAVHAPYSASAATRERLGSALELGADFETLMRSEALRSEALLPLGVEGPPTRAEDVALAKRLRDLYRAGVAELDGVFAAFLADLERHAFFTHGVLCFTSDHGESFFEHGRPFHTNWVYDTELRVPLILMGAGVTNGIEERPVSLLDLGPTWLALAGVPIPTHWRGRSLLDPDPSRVLYAFQARRGLKGTTLAVIDGSRKLIGYEDPSAVAAGKLHAAFDLAQDPGETTNLSARANWPAELERAQREKLLELLTPRFQSTRVDLTPDEQAALRGVGYVGDEADE